MDHSSAATPPEQFQEDCKPTGNKPDYEERGIDSNVTAAHLFEKSSLGEPLSRSWRKEPLSTNEASKVTQILHACKDQDIEQLIALAATEGGFVEDQVRRLACM